MEINSEYILKFLSNFLTKTNTSEVNLQKYINLCDELLEELFSSQYPDKSSVLKTLKWIQHRLYFFDKFPECVGKYIVCFIGSGATVQNDLSVYFAERIPVLCMNNTVTSVYNPSGVGQTIELNTLKNFLRSISKNKNSKVKIFSAIKFQSKDIDDKIVNIYIPNGCHIDDMFFKEAICVADTIIFSPYCTYTVKDALYFMKNYRQNFNVYIDSKTENTFDDTIYKKCHINYNVGKPLIHVNHVYYTPFSFLIRVATQKPLTWSHNHRKKLNNISKYLTSDLVMSTSDIREKLLKLKKDIDKLQTNITDNEIEYSRKCDIILNESFNIDNIFTSSQANGIEIKTSLNFEDWEKAEQLLIDFVDAEQIKDANQLAIEMEKNGYPFRNILNASIDAMSPNDQCLNCNICDIDRPIAHKLCIRLRKKLGISDNDICKHHVMKIKCETADEYYFRGLCLMENNQKDAAMEFRKAIDLGHELAGSKLYTLLKNDYSQKSENYLLHSLVPEACYDVATKNRQNKKPWRFLLYISAAQGYIPAIKDVANIECRKALNSDKNNDENQIVHHNQAIQLYDYLQQKNELDDRELFNYGKLLYEDKRYSEAINIFMKSKNGWSCYYLGKMYQYGDGVSIDYNKAILYHKEAFSKGVNKSKINIEKIESKINRNNTKNYASSSGNYYRKSTSTYSSSGSSGFCFLTTATCIVKGYDDDCDILQEYRKYRDNILSKEQDGLALIKEYYNIAPIILKNIEKMKNPILIYNKMWDDYLLPGYKLLKTKQYNEAKQMYIKLVRWLIKLCNLHIDITDGIHNA